MMDLNIGDIITFPEHAKSTVLHADGASVTLSQGAPGQFRVKSIATDGTVDLELVPGTSGIDPERRR